MTYPPAQQPGPEPWQGAYGPQQPGGSGQPGFPAPGGYGGFPPPPRKKRTALIIGLVIGLVVVLAGGGTGLYFLLSDKGNSAIDAARGVSGGAGKSDVAAADLSTVDPCGFFPASSFAAKARLSSDNQQSEVAITPTTFEDCRIDITLATDGTVVTIETSVFPIPEVSQVVKQRGFSTTTRGSLTVLKQTDRAPGRACAAAVELPDQYAVTVFAEPGQSGTAAVAADFCGLSDIALKDAIDAINHGPKHLPGYPAKSAGSLDACSLLDSGTVARALGQSGITPEPWPGRHECGYGQGTMNESTTGVLVYTDLTGEPIQEYPSIGFTKSTVAGRETFVDPTPGVGGKPSQCEIKTAVRTWKPWTGSIAVFRASATDPVPSKELIEYQTIMVVANGSGDQACGLAKQFAATAWAKLPAAS